MTGAPCAGGDGPHSGGGVEHGRADFIGLAQGPTDDLITLDPQTPSTVVSTPLQVALRSDRVVVHVHSTSDACVTGDGLTITLRDAETGKELKRATIGVDCGLSMAQIEGKWTNVSAAFANGVKPVTLEIESRHIGLIAIELE